MIFKEESALLPAVEDMLRYYETAMVMAEATDNEREMKELHRRWAHLNAYAVLIRPPAKDTTQPLF